MSDLQEPEPEPEPGPEPEPETEIEWCGDHVPRSKRFDDIYFSRKDGLAESRYVFLEGIGGSRAWVEKEQFVIGETGFGTGLNFLASWQEWKATARPGQSLCYISVEAYPLSALQIARALAGWPELNELCEQLLRVYPGSGEERHVLEFEGGSVTLILLFGDAQDVLARFPAQVDAWYLDGFAPRKNPEMWTAKVYRLLAKNSKKGAKLATFTAAGHVRRGLEKEGFRMEKQKGFGYKKERLLGEFTLQKDVRT